MTKAEHARLVACRLRIPAPEVPQLAYVYGVAFNSQGQPHDAVQALTDAWKKFLDQFDTGCASATISRDRGDIDKARMLATQLADRFPECDQARRLSCRS